MSKDKKDRINTKGLENIFGKGLTELITNIENSPDMQKSLAQEISINKIISNPYQPRVNFNTHELLELRDSINIHGLIQPIIVTKTANGNFYQLIVGERRKKAAEMAGLNKIKAIIIDVSDQQIMELALIENIQRVDLNAFEEATAYQTLINKMKWTQEDLANKVNKSRPHITNTLRILQLPAEVLKMVSDNKLTMGHVKPLLQLAPDKELIINFAKRIVLEKWSSRTIEEKVRAHFISKNNNKKLNNYKDVHLIDVENKISMLLSGAKVEIKNKKIVINYKDNHHLNELLDILIKNGG